MPLVRGAVQHSMAVVALGLVALHAHHTCQCGLAVHTQWSVVPRGLLVGRAVMQGGFMACHMQASWWVGLKGYVQYGKIRRSMVGIVYIALITAKVYQ